MQTLQRPSPEAEIEPKPQRQESASFGDYPAAGRPSQLLLKHLLDRPLSWAPDQTIVYRDLVTLTYRDFFVRVQRLAHLLQELGVCPGDRVGVLDYDSHRYLEFYFAVPMIGAVLHTANFRLSPDQLGYTISHAEDKVLFIHSDFAPLIEQISAKLASVRQRVLLSDDPHACTEKEGYAGEYESMLAKYPSQFAFPDFDENTVATLFYTTGTTGDPKGVYFTHRQLVLHTFICGFALSTMRHPVDLNSADVYLPLTPMFHAHAWGVPYIATVLGLKQVYPGRFEPQTLAGLLQRHQPTFSHGVPTVLRLLLTHPAFQELELSRLKMLIGGSALTADLAQAAKARGIRALAGYGLSETCPVVALAGVKPAQGAMDGEAALSFATCAGFPLPMVRAAIVDEEGQPLPPGRENPGELILQAPWLTQGYFKNEEESRQLWRDGWLHTGDMAYLDAEGYVRVTDRLKDVIKLGGEWISSLELENALNQHEAVAEAAVIGMPEPKWGECPHAAIVLRPGFEANVSSKEILEHLRQFIERGTIHKRAILTRIQILDRLPKTSVGKLDKKALRALVGRQP